MSEQEFRDAFKRYAYFPRTKIPYMALRKLRSLKSKQVGTESWASWLSYMARDVQLAPTLHERVQEGTARSLLPKWMQNFADNLPWIRFGDEANLTHPVEYHQATFADMVNPTPVLENESDFEKCKGPMLEYKGTKIKNPPGGSAIVVGRGPSLFENKHCEMIFEHRYDGIVVASDGGLIPLLEAGVVPEIVVSVDGSPIIKKYFEHPLVKKYGDKMKWIGSVTVSPEVYRAVKAAGIKVHWFHPMFDDWRQNESWTRLQVMISATREFPRGVPRAQSGGNAGAFGWVTAWSILKRSPVALIGIDFGYPEGTPLEQTQYYESILREAKGDVTLIKKAYKHFYHPFFKKKAFVDFVFYHYRQAFLEMQLITPEWYRMFGGTINCTGGGTLFGVGIKNMHFRDFLTKYGQ